MAARPTWQGHLKLSLVTCPVGLYTATASNAHVSFNLINPATNNRIRMVPTDPDSGPVERSDLVKGYEVSKDEYVLFDDADFLKVRLETTHTISIDSFVDEAEIDRLYWDAPFFVVPDKGAMTGVTVGEAERRGRGAFFIVQIDHANGKSIQHPGEEVRLEAQDQVLLVVRGSRVSAGAIFTAPAQRQRTGRTFFG